MFRKYVEKIQVSLKSDKNNGTVYEDRCTFLIISHSFLLRMRHVSDKRGRENQNTRFTFNNTPHPPENRAVYEIKWKNIVHWAARRWQYGACALHAGCL